MAISKGYRFPVSFDDAFPQGLVMVGEVMPDTEYQTRDEGAAGRPVRQRVDEATGKRQWKVTVTDPHEPNAKRKSFEITLLPTFSRCRRPVRCCRGCGRSSWRG